MSTTDLITTTQAATRLVEHLYRAGFEVTVIGTTGWAPGSITVHLGPREHWASPTHAAALAALPILETNQFPESPAGAFTSMETRWEGHSVTIIGAYDPVEPEPSAADPDDTPALAAVLNLPHESFMDCPDDDEKGVSAIDTLGGRQQVTA